jgi:hypothetical protein
MEPIIIRNRAVSAALVYASQRGDYRVYLYRGRVYVVRTRDQ